MQCFGCSLVLFWGNVLCCISGVSSLCEHFYHQVLKIELIFCVLCVLFYPNPVHFGEHFYLPSSNIEHFVDESSSKEHFLQLGPVSGHFVNGALLS